MPDRAGRHTGKTWEVATPFDGAADLGRRVGASQLVGQILHNRGIDDGDAARKFLDPKLTDLHDPALLADAPAAARRIAQAVARKERIVIYGDYDVDGIAGVAILHACLKMVGATADFYVPHRLEEGYGVNAEAVRKIIADGMKLMITVDCGISAAGPLAEAKATGMDVIVTDHHSLPPRLPPAFAVVHPALGGGYPNPDLCGAGVAFKLAWQTAREICGNARVDAPMKEFLLDATCLAALGTIADVVPLVGENRVLATFGLRGLPGSKHPGIRALLASAGLAGEKVDAYHVGFSLAPRLNACGRMGHARLAVELLTQAGPKRCTEIAEYLAQQNEARKKVEREITAQAVEMAVAMGMDKPDCRAIVLASEAWHGGVIGIVASRLVERFGRPTILIATSGEGAQGSGRSIPGFHMQNALTACAEHLESYGGHAMAGGIRIEPGRIDAFRQVFCAHAASLITEAQLCGTLRIDAEATLRMLDGTLAGQLSRMAPFGPGNPTPVVVVRNCEILGLPRRMGTNGRHMNMLLRQSGATMRAVGFGMGDLADQLAGITHIDVAGEPVLNTFNGNTSIEIRLKDVAFGDDS
ncbi:MAG: single-stranded-DNA-specific exonuclease RecJ [Phycisphaerae bacterium]